MDINQDQKNKLNTGTGTARLDTWKQAIRMGVRYRQTYGRSRKWAQYKNYYRGYFAEGSVPVNIIYAIGRSLIPQLYFRNPRVSIIGLKPGYAMNASVLERIDNLLINEMNLKSTMKSMILDAYLCGRGMGILGYDSEFGYSSEFAAIELEGEGSLSSFSTDGNKIEYNYNVSPGAPWFLRVNPMDFIVPWGTHVWEEAQWYAFRKLRPLRDIMEDPKYTNKKGLKGPYKTRLDSSDGTDPSKPLSEDYQTEYVELWEVHDQRTGKVMALTQDHPKFLRDEFDEMQLEGLNARVLGFNEDTDYFWWTPDARLIEQQQLEINDIRTMARAHRRVGLLKVLYDKSMVKPEELQKLLTGDPKVAVAIDSGPVGDIRKAVSLFQSHVPPDLSIAAREVREDIREIVGFSRNQMGSFEDSSGRRSATEAQIVKQAAMIRIDERRDIMADLFTNIVRGTNQCIFKNWTNERVVDIVGPDAKRYWVRFTGREIKAEVAYKVNPEEALPETMGTKRLDAKEFIQLATQIPGADVQYLMGQYASTFDWLDPKLIFSNLSPSSAPGRSPEKSMLFGDLQRILGSQGGGQPQNPITRGLANSG